MKNDPRDIITPYAFEVDPDLLGLPLATPKRRLAALVTDLIIASILTVLSAFFLAITASILFFWVAVRNRGKVWWKNTLRYGGAMVLSIGVFILTISVTNNEEENPPLETNPAISMAQNTRIDLQDIGKEIADASTQDSSELNEQLSDLAYNLKYMLTEPRPSSDQLLPEIFEDEFISSLRAMEVFLSNGDSSSVDSVRKKIVPVIAAYEINERNKTIRELRTKNSDLSDDNNELKEKVANPSFIRTMKGTAADFGLSIGWIGIYFVLCLAIFNGQTIGKKLFNIRVIRLNNKPISLWYSFERFGGYAAGIATGLFGFFQIFWDANRQGIHDKIAGTVVTDLRPSRIEFYGELRKNIVSEENLLD